MAAVAAAARVEEVAAATAKYDKNFTDGKRKAIYPVWRIGRAFDPGPKNRGFETRSHQLFFLLGKEINRHC